MVDAHNYCPFFGLNDHGNVAETVGKHCTRGIVENLPAFFTFLVEWSFARPAPALSLFLGRVWFVELCKHSQIPTRSPPPISSSVYPAFLLPPVYPGETKAWKGLFLHLIPTWRLCLRPSFKHTHVLLSLFSTRMSRTAPHLAADRFNTVGRCAFNRRVVFPLQLESVSSPILRPNERV